MTPPALAEADRAGRVEPTRVAVRIREVAEAASLEPSAGVAAQAPLAPGDARLGPIALHVTLEPGGERAAARATATNAADAPVHLESVVFGFRWTGAGAASLRFLKNGWQSWSFTGARDLDDVGTPPFPSGPWLRGLHHAQPSVPTDRAGWHESELVTVVGTSPAGAALLAGVLERGGSFGLVYARRNADAVDVEVELLVDAELAPGETRTLEAVRVALGDDASALLEAFGDELGRVAGARPAHPFRVGWCSWYHFFHQISEDIVLRNLEALVAARDELPIDIVQIDDGYQRAVGDWLETNERFPRGLAPIAAEIRAAGFTPGLWTAPFCVVRDSQIFAQHPEWMLQAEAGPGESDPFRAIVHPVWASDGAVFALDTSLPEVVAHLRGLFRSILDMGFPYLKLDFLYAAGMRGRPFDPRVSRAERLRRGLDAVRAGAGGEAFLLGCGCPLGAAVGAVDAMRIGPDVAPYWHAKREPPIPGIEETIPSTRSAVRSVLAHAWMHRRLWINDPDCLMARASDTDLSRGERETLAASIAATGGLVAFSDDVPALSRESRDLLSRAIEVSRGVDALGVPGVARAADLLSGEIAGAVVSGDAEGGVVALVNAADDAATREIDLAAHGLAPLAGSPELLLGARGAEGDPKLRVSLDPRESALLRVSRASGLAVFCDFDGTFSVQDVGSSLARRHAGPRRPEMWERYERGDITAWEYNMEILEGLELPQAEVESFLHTVDLDPGAKDLVAWCQGHGVPFRVLSDGFDFNLNRLQQIHGVRFAFEANRLDFDRGRWRLAPGFPNPECECGTGACKRGRIDTFRALHPEASIVHVGNGRVSDLCGAIAADLAFAKDTLAEELARRGVAFEPFETLHDVIAGLERLYPSILR